ncbi:MAG: patatin-like phospholipase family protein [Balneolaceae bacterium]|nr:patatin-like phospholipase family protein [Balneolaceae bacterium]MBO6546381.1 patatin-like phospholipase family protein [Balneolaceae bacterium]MBO6648740.1 patatin-like phospholipase family protein [Balneolaceae bacterium]
MGYFILKFKKAIEDIMTLEERTNLYLNDSRIKRYVAEAISLKESGKEFSDIVDDRGNQYVDLVQEGGGVLGIALVGYTYIMEKAGIRFFSLAGTSAGAINTMLLAATGSIDSPKSERILEILEDQNLIEFVDGRKSTRKFIQAYIDKKGKLVFYSRALLATVGIIIDLMSKLGLNPGNKFEHWISEILSDNGIQSIDDLLHRRREIPDSLRRRAEESNAVWKRPDEAGLVFIASDITTQTKAKFPEMTNLYWEKPSGVNPSKLVRASMSIPFFFTPMKVSNIPNKGSETEIIWNETVGYDGDIPEEVKFVDGGLLSNFPINVFHISEGVPSRPTFGAKLSALRKKQNKTEKLFQFSGSMLGTVRHLSDYDFIFKNPDYRHLITSIDPNEEIFNWLDFNMPLQKKVDLFEVGANKALKFLKDFEWDDYKKERAGLVNNNSD